MQKDLQEYRSRKRRVEKLQRFQQVFKSLFMSNNENTVETTRLQTTIAVDPRPNLPDSDSEYNGSEHNAIGSTVEEDLGKATYPQMDDWWYMYTLRIIYFLLWATLYMIAIQLKFGIVYLMFSALGGIYLNTRTGPKQSNEVSAYSVFNKNCESIDGTLKAEQFEREIGIRAS